MKNVNARKSQTRPIAHGSFFFCILVLSIIFALRSGDAIDRFNVLLISIDTLRADRLGCYGYHTKTPAIDSLAAGSAIFENTIAQVPLTLPSHSTIFTGLFPPQHGVRNNENFVLAETTNTIAEALRSKGYSTAGFVGSFSLDSRFGISQGFEFYEDRIGKGHDPEINRHVERRADTVWKLSRQWLEKQKGPWFAFVHFFDPHFPFHPPGGHARSYDGEIAYTDQMVGQMMKWLRDRNQIDTTVVILLSDHGESLGEHGEDNHGIFLYDATLKVPFLLRVPGYEPRRIPEQVRLADVAPTIAELTGIPFGHAAGVSLVPFVRGKGKELPAYSESYYANLLMGWAPQHSLRWQQKKWIDSPRQEFYDLAKDAKETRNLYASGAVPAGFRSEMAKYLREASPQAQSKVDPETQEKLASLGYITGAAPKSVRSGFDPKEGIGLWVEIEAAVRDAQSQRWTDAEKRFRAVLKKQPENVIAQKFLANVLRKQNRQDEAILLMQAALKSPLHQMETRSHLAEAFIEKKEYTLALHQLNLILKEEPSNDRALSVAAKLQSTLKKDEEAMMSYGKLSSIRDLTEEEALHAAAIHLTNRRNQEAEKYFRSALRANAESAPAWKGLGLILASKQEWDGAMEALLKANDCDTIKALLPRAKLQNSDLRKITAKCP